MNLSFAGCGFLGIYHVGVASCFREYAPHVLISKIAGASVGSVAAAALICDVSLGQTTTDILSIACKARSRTLGPLSPMFDLNHLIEESLRRGLPPNAHQLCNGRLFISVTRWEDKKNVLLSQFNTREELIEALICSCFIPGYSGVNLPVVRGVAYICSKTFPFRFIPGISDIELELSFFRGIKYVDGGLSNNLPVLDENTVTVSPFAGEHDICPQDESCNILQINLANTSIAISAGNMYRICRILFPPKPEILSKMCQQGFDDALKFLQRRNVISCTRCLGVQSSMMLSEMDSETNSDINSSSDNGSIPIDHTVQNHNCAECKTKRQKAHSSRLPEAVVQAIEEVCTQMNKGIANWLLRFAPIKWLSYLGKPYLVPMAIPVDITLVICRNVYEKVPDIKKEVQSRLTAVVNLIKQALSKVTRSRHAYSAKFSCQLAITEFDYTEEDVMSSYAFPIESVQPHETCTVKTEEEKMPKRKLSFKTPESSVRLLQTSEQKQQRKSYAGFTSNFQNQNAERVRRKSLTEISKPERVIRNMKFGFIVGLTPSISTNDKKKVVEALKSLGEENKDLNVLELTNKALSMKRDYINHRQEDVTDDNEENLGEIRNVSKKPLMSYYYVEDDTVKLRELYNVSDADTSIVLPDEEREVNNQLQWEKDWIHMIDSPSNPKIPVNDTLDDDEFDTSDINFDLSHNVDSFDENKSFKINNTESYTPSPRRKSSFIIVK